MGTGQQALLALGGGVPSSGLQFEFIGTTLTGNNGDQISLWEDSSSNNNDATQATAGSRPNVVDPGLNGFKVARWSNSDGRSLGLTTGIALTSFTIFAVVKVTVNGVKSIVGAQSGGVQLRLNNKVPNLLKAGVADMGSANTALGTSNFYTVAVTYSNPNIAFYLNGSADGTPTSAQTFTGNLNVIGNNFNGEAYADDIAHEMLYNRVLSASELTSVFTYLRDLWGHY